jgi:acetoin utilization deacetylase AcuC-like enzyme
MYLSAHQYPFYPGTGAPEETGAGEGLGTTVNVGLPAGAGDAELAATFDRVFLPALEWFAPDLVIVSSGFDMHRDDPLAGLQVTERGYRAAAARLCALADSICGGRVVVLLEGGYDLGALGRSVVAVTEVMAGRPVGEQADSGAAGGAAGALQPATARAIARTLLAHAERPWASAAGPGGEGDA